MSPGHGRPIGVILHGLQIPVMSKGGSHSVKLMQCYVILLQKSAILHEKEDKRHTAYSGKGAGVFVVSSYN